MSRTRKQFTERQVNLIDEIIKPFAFSPNPQELAQQVKDLKLALTNKAKSNNPYYWLGQCLHLPENYFQELVLHANEACSLADIKNYILESIHAQLDTAANIANVTFKKLQWNYTQIIAAVILQDDETKTFKRGNAWVDGSENPWQLPLIEGKIYTRAIREVLDKTIPSLPEKNIWVDVSVTCVPGVTPIKPIWVDVAPNFNADLEDRIREQNFFFNVHTKADKQALDYAAGYAVNFFSLQSPSIVKKALTQTPTKKIITHAYYFNLLKLNKINLNYFLDVTEQQAENFTDEKLINLVEKNICNFSDLKALTAAQKKIATHPIYYAMLNKGSLDIKNIRDMSHYRCQLLLHPFVSNLIQMGKLTFQQARELPRHVATLVTNRLYYEYFRKDVPFQALLLLNENQTKLMLHPTFAKLVTSGQVDLGKVAAITATTCETLTQFPYFIDWIQSGIIRLDHLNACKNRSFLALHVAQVYSKRLLAIFSQTPYLIGLQKDNLELISQELPIRANDWKMSEEYLQEELLFLTIMEIKKELLSATQKKFNKIYDEMLLAIDIETRNPNWQNVFHHLIALAEKYVAPTLTSFIYPQKRINQPQLFSPANKKQKLDCHKDDAFSFCERLASLRELNLVISQHTLRRVNS